MVLLPMDESCSGSIRFGEHSLVWEVDFKREFIGICPQYVYAFSNLAIMLSATSILRLKETGILK